MARIRSIKPEFWASEQIAACSRDARLIFIGLWSFADDAGVHPASYLRLKMQVFPADNCNEADIKTWITELIQQGLLIEYEVDNKKYWLVTGWQKHQKIARPYFKYPALPKQMVSNYQAEPEHDISTAQAVHEHGIDTTGNRYINRDRNINNISEVETSPITDFSSGSIENNFSQGTDVQVIFAYWQTVMEHPQAKLDYKRKVKIEQALRLGYNMEQLKQAIDGCKLSAFHRGKNNNQKIYDDITLILRDASRIESFIQNCMGGNQVNFDDDVTAGAL